MDSFSFVMGIILILEILQTIGILVIAICKFGDRINYLLNKVYNEIDLYLDNKNK